MLGCLCRLVTIIRGHLRGLAESELPYDFLTSGGGPFSADSPVFWWWFFCFLTLLL